jgi:hypothetical protein
MIRKTHPSFQLSSTSLKIGEGVDMVIQIQMLYCDNVTKHEEYIIQKSTSYIINYWYHQFKGTGKYDDLTT